MEVLPRPVWSLLSFPGASHTLFNILIARSEILSTAAAAPDIPDAAADALYAREAEVFAAARPVSRRLGQEAKAHLYGGVPMHWMADWPTPYPLFLKEAHGATLVDADGHAYADFCLGDTGAMFGHSPAPVAAAIAAQAARGLTAMLASEDAAVIGRLLADRFGLPIWQVCATATDANRYALRWARAVTQRPVVVVFDGCYHGTVEDAMVRLGPRGETLPRPGLLGQVHDLARSTRVVPFNDPDALAKALAPGDVAAVLTEPALTNCGMVLPRPGFLDDLRHLTREAGTLLIIDETHTFSTGPGGHTRTYGLEPDLFVLGKPVAGGLPAAVYGASAAMAERMAEAHARAAAGGHGHSGMGTTLSANPLQLAAMRATLEHVATPDAFRRMIALANRLADGLEAAITGAALPWSVTRLGARCEIQFRATPPRTGAEAEAAFRPGLERALHLAFLNRGIVITPFHNMTLCSPATTEADVDRLLAAVDDVLLQLTSR